MGSPRKLICSAILGLSVIGVLPARASPPTFTGVADVDFSGGGVYTTYTDDFSLLTHQTDVALPVDCIQSTASGIDIKALWLDYDPPTDTLSVGIESWENLITGHDVFAGDVDGDGTSGSSCSVSDIASFGGTESVCLYVGPSTVTDPIYIFGKENSRNASDTILNHFRAAPFEYLGGEDVPIPPDSFGVNSLPVDLAGPVDPRSDYPHVEFRIGRFGALMGFDALSQPVVFSYGGFMGVAYTTIPSDFAPDTPQDALALEMSRANFPDPRGGLSGTITQHWTDNDPRDGQTAPVGSILSLTGQFVKGATTTQTYTAHLDGSWASYPSTNYQSLRLGDYVLVISPAFGYIVESSVVSHPTTPHPNAPATVNVTIDLQEHVTLDIVLLVADTDDDGIADVEEEPNPQDCKADAEACSNSDGDGLADYMDLDSDDDGIADGNEDVNHDGDVDVGETDPLNSDSDGDGVHDGTEVGITAPTEDTSTTLNPNDGQPNYIPDEDPSSTTDPLDQDTDDDGIPDGVPPGTASGDITDTSGEDVDHDGAVDTGETDASNPDTDGDGLQDGTELGVTLDDIGPDTDVTVFQPDGDGGTTTTDPLDDDSDDDGLLDGNLTGIPGGGAGEDVDLDGVKDPDETNPRDADTDNDCVQDGAELGLTQPQGQNTRNLIFEPDTDPSTTTDPLDGDDNPDSCPVDATPTSTPAPDTEVPASPTPTTTPGPTSDPEGIAMGGGGGGSCNAAPGGRPEGYVWLLAVIGLVAVGRRYKLKLAVSLATLVSAGSGTIWAQDTAAGVEVQQFHPAEDLAGTIMTSGSTNLAPGKVSIGAWVNYAVNPLVYVDLNGDPLYILQSGVLGADLVGGIGIFKFLHFGVTLPATLYQRGDTDNPFAHNPSTTDFNDVSLKFRLHLLDIEDGLGLALEPKVWLPTGSANSYSGGTTNVGAAVLLDKNLGDNWLGLNVGYRYRPEIEDLANLMVGSEVYYRLGLGIAGHVSYFTFDLFGAVGTAAQDGDLAKLASKPLEIMVGASRPIGKTITGTLALGTGLIAGYGTPDFRSALGFTFGAPRATHTDRDGDGFLDDVDRCPNEAEDFDGFEDDDGCPELDNDKDGIPDVKDKCPNDPEDFDGFEDEDGCPDPDNDNDGILDGKDKCPNDPEDKDGFEDEDGCPDPDNDKDRIVDIKDQCPNYPENYNGFKDEDGCPDVIGPVEVVDNRLQLGMILFEWDKDIILPQSSVVLDMAVQVFKDNPTLTARIEGHTSSEGTVEHNQDLSERRAVAVRDYMVNHGIDQKRLEVIGMASTQPIVQDDNTEELRAQNRRMEWVILTY